MLKLIEKVKVQGGIIKNLSILTLLLQQDVKEMLPIVEANSVWSSKSEKEQDELRESITKLTKILYQ